MDIVLIVLHILLYIFVVLLFAVRPSRESLSQYELHRRERMGDRDAMMRLRRQKARGYYGALQPFLVSFLSSIWMYLGIILYGWGVSIAVVAIGVLAVAVLARRGVIIKVAELLFVWLEPHVSRLTHRYPKLFSYIRGKEDDAHRLLGSKDELIQILTRAHDVLDDTDRNALLGLLGFSKKTVAEIMVPRKHVVMIKKSEILGPLVLDELHKSGHTYFPVTDREGGKVIGFLDIEGLMQIHADARSSRVESRMDARVSRIAKVDTLDRALVECIEGRQTMLLVVNDQDEMVGIVTLGDIIGELFGRERQES